MTERDLYEFLAQERKIKRLLAEYKECEGVMCSPKSPGISGAPGGNGGEDKLMKLIDRRVSIQKKIEECAALRDVAERRLDRAAEALKTELQTDVFNLLYRKGYEISDIAATLCYHKSHIYRQRTAILEIVATLK